LGTPLFRVEQNGVSRNCYILGQTLQSSAAWPSGVCAERERVYLRLAMQDAARALTKQFLAWVAEAPRSYADADAWRRSCPHLSVWEDAIANGLIQFKNGSTMKESQILLTGRGRSFLKMN
jgi:transposase